MTPVGPEMADLLNRFDYHPPDRAKIRYLHEEARAECKDVALWMLRCLPPGRERALALTKLEEAMFWANAAIARNHNQIDD